MLKLSFTGDLLCYAIQNKASQTDKWEYDYKSIFEPVSNQLRDCDYLVGSLETPLAEASWGYTKLPTNFNTPHQFARDAKDAGFSLLTTGNNHCLDRGLIGLKNTIRVLDYYKLDHTGTYLTKEDSENILVKDFNGVKVAFLSYTYGTNSRSNKHVLSEEEEFHVDLFRKQDVARVVKRSLFRRICSKIKFLVKKRYIRIFGTKVPSHTSVPRVIIDSVNKDEINNPDNSKYVSKFISKIKEAQRQADLVVLCMHSGGQFNFNEGVGEYTKFIVDLALSNGVNIVVGNHTHCAMPAILKDSRTFVAYALGNFCFTPKDGYYVDGVYADYSILLNLHIDEQLKEIADVTFSVLKSVRNSDDSSSVHSVYDLYQSETDSEQKRLLEIENQAVVNKFIGRESGELAVMSEYNFKSFNS